MALAARVTDNRAERSPLQRRTVGVQTRRHATAAGPRPLVKATAGIEAAPRPNLMLVPRHRRAARIAVVACTVVVLAMLGAAAFQTLLAQRQLEIDKLTQGIDDARGDYEMLRRERAELRSPARLAQLAEEMGMVPATQSQFMTIAADVVATVQQSVGHVGDGDGDGDDDPLAQFRVVKSVAWGHQ